MTRLSVLLALGLLASALVLVNSAYESRRLFAEIDRARAEQARLDTDFKRLEADAQTQATHGKVDRTARDKLGMRAPTPGVTYYVTDQRAASGVAR